MRSSLCCVPSCVPNGADFRYPNIASLTNINITSISTKQKRRWSTGIYWVYTGIAC
jgi:hypothetical protein